MRGAIATQGDDDEPGTNAEERLAAAHGAREPFGGVSGDFV